jgi:hypothetical protein
MSRFLRATLLSLGLLLSAVLPVIGQDITSNLVGHWKLDEAPGSTTAADSSGSGFTGTLTGMDANTDWVVGKMQGALDFTGASQYVTMGNVLSYQRTDVFSLACWYKMHGTSPTAQQVIVSKAQSSGSFRGYFISVQGAQAGDPFWFEIIGVSLVRAQGSFARPNDTEWHHLVVTYDGSSTVAGMRAYVDGVSQTITPVVDTLNADITHTSPLTISGRNGAIDFFDGVVDDVRIYSRTLTAVDVIALYAASRQGRRNTISD